MTETTETVTICPGTTETTTAETVASAVRTSKIPAGVIAAVKLKCAEIVAAFPAVTHVWGYASTPDHNNRRCIDYMVGSNKAAGDAVAQYHVKNRARLGVRVIIWYGRIWRSYDKLSGARSPSRAGEWGTYNEADKHRDHPHVEYDSGAYVAPAGAGTGTVWLDRLRPGVTDSDSVRLVQQALNRLGITVAATGDYDPQTVAAVKIYQARLGDAPQYRDGILGPKQTERLFADAGLPVTIRTDPSGEPPPMPVTSTYTVRAGDTLTSIAAALGLEGWQVIADLNPGLDPDKIQVGQVITIPAPTTPEKPEEPPVSHLITAAYGNILRRTDTMPGRKRWPERRSDVISHLRSTRASVLMLCEVDKITAAEVAAGLGQRWSYYPSQLATEKRFSPLAILWDSGIWERREQAFVREYTDNENRFLQRLPLVHQASGKTVAFYASHLENDGDTSTDGHVARYREAADWARWSLQEPGIWGADLNSTTRSGSDDTARRRQKPRPILRKAGWAMLSDRAGVDNREYASHHGGKGTTPKGPWIDDMGYRGVEFVSGGLVRTDRDDASDHHFLTMTVRL